jgi:hypothetical protein
MGTRRIVREHISSVTCSSRQHSHWRCHHFFDQGPFRGFSFNYGSHDDVSIRQHTHWLVVV